MIYWGWIPTLDSKHNVAMLPASLYDLVNTPDPEVEGTHEQTRPSDLRSLPNVTIEGSLIRIDYDWSVLPPQFIYDYVKGWYHIDFTHEANLGLRCVESPDRKDALDAIAVQFMQWAGTDVKRHNDGALYADDLMNRLGFIEYGLSFLDQFEGELSPNIYTSTKEVLLAGKRFLQTRVSFENADISYSMANRVEWMTWLVIALTFSSVIITGVSFLVSANGIDDVALQAGLLLLAFVPLIILAIAKHSEIREWFDGRWHPIRRIIDWYRSRFRCSDPFVSDGRSI